MTPTSIVAIGDMHNAPGDRQPDRDRALDEIIRGGQALENRLGAWLVTGDVFHAGAAAKDCNGIDERFQRMASAAPVVAVYGNHDRKGDLDGFARLASIFPIVVIDQPQTVRVQLATGQWLSIFVLPYPHRGGLVAAGVAPGAVVPVAADLLEPIFMQAVDDLARAAAAGDLTMMMGHVNVSGAIASTGQPNIGHEIELSPRHLDRLGSIPKILGHIHKPQDIAGATYVGSICRLDYGEIEAKRWLEVEFTDEETRLISHPIDVVPMFHVDAWLRREGLICAECGHPWHTDQCPVPTSPSEIAAFPHTCSCLAHEDRPRDWTGCDVRVRYTYQASERAALNPELARVPFASALRLKVEGIAQADRELRAPGVATAKTLPEKYAAYRQETALAASVATKLAMLQDFTEDQLVQDVARELAAIEQPEKATVAA